MKAKKITGVFLAVIMLISVVIPVYANYDPTVPGIPSTTWTIVELNHWVVRGETLDDIAVRYGTTVNEIKLHNAEYFNDLANRNKTTGLNTQVEHGVKLLVYNMVRVVRYVQRGDTLDNLANGRLTRGDFVLRTTPDAIIAENKTWFDSLRALNTTRNTANELEESYAIHNVDHISFDSALIVAATDAGSPLVITVPIQFSSRGEKKVYLRESLQYMKDNGERVGNPSVTDGTQITFPNTMPTNTLPAVSWTLAANGTKTASIVNYKIPGLYGGTWWK